MAVVRSVGVSQPAGLSYLIAEGLALPTESDYTWSHVGKPGDELLVVGLRVIWTRYGAIHRVYSFPLERETIVQALFADFPQTSNLEESAQQSEDRSKAKPAVNSLTHQVPEIIARAIVILLKTQAHIYFIGGSTHIINLPFEVEKAFPTPYGLILQRVPTAKSITVSFQPAKTPVNSFATFQPNSTSSSESWRIKASADEPDPFYSRLWKPHTAPSIRSTRRDHSHHVYLRDPLTEIGLLGSVLEEDTATPGRVFSEFSRLPAGEDIIYASTSSETSDFDTLIALTWNHSSSQYTIWEVVQTPYRVSLDRRRKLDDFLEARRRNSHGPGTGTSTPGIRASINPRESFGGHNESRTTIKSRKPKKDTDLANQLDAAFDGATNTSQVSRRVSSLLARSDLTTGKDATGLIDPTASKRLTSFTGMRTSFGIPTTSFSRKSTRPLYFGTELQDLPSAGIINNPMDIDSDDDLLQSAQTSRSLQQDVAFIKFHTFKSLQDRNDLHKDKESFKPVTVVLQTPPSQQDNHLRAIAIYLHEPISRKVFCTDIDVFTHTSTLPSETKKNPHIRVRRTDVFENVGGICKLGEFPSTILVMLACHQNGATSLMKHVPWSKPKVLQIPTTLLWRNPYQINIVEGLRRRREGSLKRVMSDGIDRLSGLRSSSLLNQFDVSDSKNVWHRLELHIGPTSNFVRKLLNVCQFVVTMDSNDQKSIFQLWDDVKHWSIYSGQSSNESEWRTFLVLICSLFTLYLPQEPKSRSSRAKQKTGLLRSSSGAQIDMGSFDTMILAEDKFGMFSPPWLQDSSWRWASELSLLSGPSKHQKSPMLKPIDIMEESLQQSREFVVSPGGQAAFGNEGYFPLTSSSTEQSHTTLIWLLAALHLIREEEKLNVLNAENVQALNPLLAQIGGWLGCTEWDWREPHYYSTESIELERYSFSKLIIEPLYAVGPQISPPSIFAHIEESIEDNVPKQFPTLGDLQSCNQRDRAQAAMEQFTPRTLMVLKILSIRSLSASQTLSELIAANWGRSFLEELPEGVVLSLRSALVTCQVKPPPVLSSTAIALIGREDLAMLENHNILHKPQGRGSEHVKHEATRDYHQAASSNSSDVENIGSYDEAAEMDRQSITRLIFAADQRFAEAARLVHPLKPSITRCLPEPEWTDQDLLEAQQELAKVIAFRTLAVSPGRAMIFYNARHPLLTEKFPIHGFTLSTVMRPSNITVAADRTAYTEERVSWAFFHAGVEAGLTISRSAKGLNTSWILFNKPKELGDRHAGFLLALGLNGHLKTIAKWVAFKYLTPKHTMTSIGLLLGLAASHVGTMNPLITRLLSVHVTRMLPPGAAELNLCPMTQTTGIMALGLLYHNTQHRRMTEVMLSEIECVEREEGANPMEDLRDEGYRLAAGFALGYINLGQGRKTKGLHDMKIVERLLSLITATRKISLVHILDKATAGATIAIALIFLKTGDKALAKKIDIPDTKHQFEYVRPDIFLLRTVARHLIMWDDIKPTIAWMRKSLPISFQQRLDLKHIRALHTEDLPLYNVLAGLCLALGLRFAGTGREDIRDILVAYLDQFIRINNLPALHYDGKLTRITARNCQDVIVLAAAAVMAGTGDLQLLRRYRSLHGRASPDTSYGSHLAAHQGVGLLFLGGGTHTLCTSNLAVASLLCSFYPLFPSDVQDNKAHLQAFRHFWVLATEARCLTIRNARTLKPLIMKILVTLKTGKQLDLSAPCLLPELDTISQIASDNYRYWQVTLDFEGNLSHLTFFKQHQTMFVLRKGPYDTHSNAFVSTVQTLNDRHISQQIQQQVFEWIFDLPSLAVLDQSERELVLPGDTGALTGLTGRMTVIDDRLTLERECLASTKTERLWSLRLLFAWTEYASKTGGTNSWLGKDFIDSLKARIAIAAQE